MDQIVTDWAAKDAEAIASAFGSGAMFTSQSTRVFVSPEAGDCLSQYVPGWEMTRTGDAVDSGDGTFTFPVTFVSAGNVVEHVTWKMTVVDDELVELTECPGWPYRFLAHAYRP